MGKVIRGLFDISEVAAGAIHLLLWGKIDNSTYSVTLCVGCDSETENVPQSRPENDPWQAAGTCL